MFTRIKKLFFKRYVMSEFNIMVDGTLVNLRFRHDPIYNIPKLTYCAGQEEITVRPEKLKVMTG